ncbi:MAG TPA: hypothetical protein VHW64_00665 [Nocardioides sp.]|uniref:hypothetical protein n=1 Tax=Nocardioides sp. TaxID=35761 RepID=UPI002E2F3983|nr:hypothetical protein [Nocardioides sp.]HEX3929186.1 hypothetical protein [Nocardioides sp.]
MTGGDTSCPALPTALAGDEGTSISRCEGLAAYARQLGLPLSGAEDLWVTGSALHRRSGTVSVALTLTSGDQRLRVDVSWRMTYVDGHWWVTGFAGGHRT